MPKQVTCFYLEDDDHPAPVFCRMKAEPDDYGNVYVEIVNEGGPGCPDENPGRILIPFDLADEFLAAFGDCLDELRRARDW